MSAPVVKLDTWTKERAKTMLLRRYKEAKAAKGDLADQWERNLRCVYTSQPDVEGAGELSPDMAALPAGGGSPVRASAGINLTLKNARLLHSQLSANPPSCVPRPTTSDQADRRAARAADRVIRHSLRAFHLQERVDQTTLSTILRGVGVLKVWHDPTRGDILGVNKKTGAVLLEGEIHAKVIDPNKWHPDPAAKSADAVRFVIEEVDMTREDFLVRFPEHRACLRKGRTMGDAAAFDPSAQTITGGGATEGEDEEVEVITVLEYWETGLPSNGYAGRFAVYLADGTVLVPPMNSPHAFSPRPTTAELKEARTKQKKLRRRTPKARLPYGWLTDIDVPESLWGKAFVEFAEPLQDLSNRVASTILANMQAHAVVRLLADEGVEFPAGTFTNDPTNVVRYRKKNPTVGDPKYMEPARLPAELGGLGQWAERGVGDMAGTNEAMFGQQSRETSGYSMQYSVNQANLIRRRLFNKYVLFIEWLYQTILDLAIKHWDTPRMTEVLGREKAYEVEDLRGSDIVGGYSLVVEYGTSLSLDPMTRRDEILRLRPVLKEAGISDRTILAMLKLGELDSLSDIAGLAEDRSREIIEYIVENEEQVQPEFAEDHDSMLAYFLLYVMTKEFHELDFESRKLIREHIRLRFAQSRADKAEQSGQAAGGQPPMGGMVPGGAPGGAAPTDLAGAQPPMEAVPAGAQSTGPGAAASEPPQVGP